MGWDGMGGGQLVGIRVGFEELGLREGEGEGGGGEGY